MPEYEYRVVITDVGARLGALLVGGGLVSAQKTAAKYKAAHIERRIPAGPWERVEEGTER